MIERMIIASVMRNIMVKLLILCPIKFSFANVSLLLIGYKRTKIAIIVTNYFSQALRLSQRIIPSYWIGLIEDNSPY